MKTNDEMKNKMNKTSKMNENIKKTPPFKASTPISSILKDLKKGRKCQRLNKTNEQK